MVNSVSRKKIESMPSAGSRKRPAPGSSPLGPERQITSSPQMSTDQYLQWHQQDLNNGIPSYPDAPANYNANVYHGMSQAQHMATTTPASKELARIPGDQQIVSRTAYNNVGNDAWPIVSEEGLPQPSKQPWLNNSDDLEQKAQLARRETQAKRKQIPPFVQKLSR